MPATPTGEALVERLPGTWRMLSWTVQEPPGGQARDAIGPQPRGYITYTPDGRVMVLVTASERRAPADLVPSAEEKLALYDTVFAYGGTWSVDGERVQHHIDIS